jgi:hypothetical protein
MYAYNIIKIRCENLFFERSNDVSTCTSLNYGEPYAQQFCAVKIFFFIVNRCHALLTVAMNCYSKDVIYARVGVTVFFVKCFSANQIQVFYMKV